MNYMLPIQSSVLHRRAFAACGNESSRKSPFCQGFAFLACLLAVWSLATSAMAAEDAGPRLGAYNVVQVAGPNSGSITAQLILKEGGVYEVYDMPAKNFRSRGKYRYDAAEKRVHWLDGLNYEMGRGGTFTIENGGAVHRIMLGTKTYAIIGE